jgi:hypothetical protein
MNTRNKWSPRGRRIRDKAQGTRKHNQDSSPIPNPTIFPRSHQVCSVSEPIVKLDNQIYELLSIFTNRLTRLENYVYNTSERLTRDQIREDNLPGAETLWRLIQQGKAGEFRKGSNVYVDPTRTPTKNRRGYYRDNPSEPQGRPRTIDITQCRYCSS